MAVRRADLVLEGGGAKGVAFVGALSALVAAGYSFERVAGTSAGALTGSVVAAMVHAGEPMDRLPEIADTLDLSKIRYRGLLAHTFGPLRSIGETVTLLTGNGIYTGDYLHDWLSGVLHDLGVRTFGDLRRNDPGSSLTPERDYAFVAVTSDLSRRRMTLLPWDYTDYGLDPDEQVVADAVRASAALPFVFPPVKLPTPSGDVTLVDGGILSNYPITVFDQPDDVPSRWPTIGIRLSAREDERSPRKPVHGPIRTAVAVVETAMAGWDARHIDDPVAQEHTIFVDTGGFSALDFDMDAGRRAELVVIGREAAERWLARHRIA